MYGLKENVDLSFLVDAELLQICIGANETNFNLSNDTSISVTSKFLVAYPDGKLTECSDAETSAGAIPLLQKKVLSFSPQKDGRLTLTFQDGYSLVLIDDSVRFESYVISHAGQEIVV